MMHGKSAFLFEELMGSMLAARVHVLSDSVFCTGPCALDASSASESWRKEEAVLVKVLTARTATTVHVSQLSCTCALATHQCKTLQKRKAFMSETGRDPETVLDRIIFAIIFNDITCFASSGERSSYLCSKIRGWLLVFLWSGNSKDLEI